ncbi:MAG TPA: sensory rhodopsin transducer [Bryobacteraceae bacterium]|nr:sensory rhodopsin transducer [Bryobacteraceae bacterium]
MKPIGRKRWAIAEGYIPGWSNGPEPAMTSHECVCFLNASDRPANVSFTVFYTDREPVCYRFPVPAQRSKHIRLRTLTDPEPIPAETEFSSVIESDVPIVCQHTRLDSRQSENALLSTIAFPGDE